MSTPTKSQSMNEVKWEDPDFPFAVIENEDDSFTLTWDENHPATCVFNNYTEDDFVQMLTEAAKTEPEKLGLNQ